MNYIKSSSYLQELALTQIAIHLIHHSEALKKEIFCLTKSTFEMCINRCNEDKDELRKAWGKTIELNVFQLVDQILLPDLFKPKLLLSVLRIGVRCLNWVKSSEVQFGILRQQSADFLCTTDWTLEGNLRERSIAERLVQCETIDIYKRYQIACIHFLERDSRELWNRIPAQTKQIFYEASDMGETPVDEFPSVLAWSFYFARNAKIPISESQLHIYGLIEAIDLGLSTVVYHIWGEICQETRREIVIDYALLAAEEWIENIKSFWADELFTSVDMIRYPTALPTTLNNILQFFLLQMSEEQRVIFFTRAFQSNKNMRVLECFLYYPYQNYLLPMLNDLMNVLPLAAYDKLLFLLICKHTNNYKFTVQDQNMFSIKENLDYDYTSLLFDFLELTSKHCHLSDGNDTYFELDRILSKKPFDDKDVALFKSILNIIPFTDKNKFRAHWLFGIICCNLLAARNFELFQYFLEKCIVQDEIYDFKKKFILSKNVKDYVLRKSNNEQFLKEFFAWGSLTEEEISEFKQTC